MTDLILTVDRPGPQGFVIVQDEDERQATLPVAWFARPPREGDVFRLSLTPDDALRAARQQDVAALIDELDSSSGEDDEEIL